LPIKERLDKLLVLRSLAKSRELAKAYIMEGKVFVDGKKVTKVGISVSENSEIALKGEELPYVSRGGLKLEAAIHFFTIGVQNKIIMDVGCSTGGFTDCLLKMGAKKVYCIDVGYGQLAWSLRNDPRVIVMERTNIRYLDRIVQEHVDRQHHGGSKKVTRLKAHDLDELAEGSVDMATVDVSFISLKKVVPAILTFLKESAEMILLVKPQFEVGKGEVGKGGIVREEEKRLAAVHGVQADLEKRGLKTVGIFQSPIPGHKGNIEYALYMKRGHYGR
jgi:23S rRNA (cytidine1920-2'-O)/16S rRNA (cytidine1409-2'-O)-methyltransferase